MKDKELQKIANEIMFLEKCAQNHVEETKSITEKMINLTEGLSFQDLILIDEYIQKNI